MKKSHELMVIEAELNPNTDDQDLIKAMSKEGLVQREVHVNRGGKSFMRKQWVRASDVEKETEKAAPKAGKDGEVPKDRKPRKVNNVDDIVNGFNSINRKDLNDKVFGHSGTNSGVVNIFVSVPKLEHVLGKKFKGDTQEIGETVEELMRKEFGPNASIQDVKDRQGGVTVSMSLDNFKGGKKEPEKEPPKKESKGNERSTKFNIGDKVRHKYPGGRLSGEEATITGYDALGYYTFTWDSGEKDEGSGDKDFSLVSSGKKESEGSKADRKDKKPEFNVNEFSNIVNADGKEKGMAYLKESGITWKEDKHPGINWMRASMAAKKGVTPAGKEAAKHETEKPELPTEQIKPKKGVKEIETPELRKLGDTQPSRYRVSAFPVSEKEFNKKAFKVDDVSQITSFVGIGGVKFYRIASKEAFGTRDSGGAANMLDVTIPESVFKELANMTNTSGHYYVKVEKRQPNSKYSSGNAPFITGGLLSKFKG